MGIFLVLYFKNNLLLVIVVIIELMFIVNELLLRICKGWLIFEINGEEVFESIVGECEFIGNIGIYLKWIKFGFWLGIVYLVKWKIFIYLVSYYFEKN